MDRNNDLDNIGRATNDSLRDSAGGISSGSNSGASAGSGASTGGTGQSAARRADDLTAGNYDRDALGADDYTGADREKNHDAASRNDAVGETTGGLAGALTGAALGSLGGPIGTIIGGIAGAVGGWWSGKEISIAASKYSDDDDSFYRSHYERSRTGSNDDAREASSSDRDVSSSAFSGGTSGSVDAYDTRRPAYQLGHLASQNPDYSGREFDDVEPELQRGWTNDLASKHGDWSANRDYAKSAYSARRGSTGGSGMADRASHVGGSDNMSGAGAMGGSAMGGSSSGTSSGTSNSASNNEGSAGSSGSVNSTGAGTTDNASALSGESRSTASGFGAMSTGSGTAGDVVTGGLTNATGGSNTGSSGLGADGSTGASGPTGPGASSAGLMNGSGLDGGPNR